MAKIMKKKERTLEEYKRVGAQVRLCKVVVARTVLALSRVLTAEEYVKVRRIIALLDEAASKADDRMFHDHPELGSEYTKVFYGVLCGPAITVLDKEIRQLAKVAADEAFT